MYSCFLQYTDPFLCQPRFIITEHNARWQYKDNGELSDKINDMLTFVMKYSRMLLDVDWLVQSAFQVSGEPKDSCNFIRHFKTCGKPEKMRLDYDQCSNTKEHREVLVDVVISLLVIRHQKTE